MIAATSEWSWMICVLLLRTAAITTVILLAAALAVRWYRGASAAIRHRLWLTAVLGCAATPIVLAFLPARIFSLGFPVVETPPQETLAVATNNDASFEHRHNAAAMPLPAQREFFSPDENRPFESREFDSIRHNDVSANVYSPAAPIDTLPGSSIESQPSASFGEQLALLTAQISESRIPSLFVVAWMVIACVLTARIFIALAAMHRFLRRHQEGSLPHVNDLLAALCADMKLRVPVGLLVSRELDVPTLAGVRRPTIVLPIEATTWPRDRLSIVLSHELAHVTRRDLLTQLVVDFVVAAGWFQPLLWYAARRLRIEREIACDDLVLQTGSAPCDYADELLSVASTAMNRRRPSLVTVTMAGPSTVEQRIRSILNPLAKRQPLTRRATACITAITALVLVTAAYLTPTFTMPPAVAVATEAEREVFVTLRNGSSDEPSGEIAAVDPEEKTSTGKKNEKAPPEKPMDELSGHVIDENGEPAANVEVSLLTKDNTLVKTSTDASGRFTLTMGQQAWKYQTLWARADNGRRLGVFRFQYEKPEGGLTALNLTIEPAREVRLQVKGGQDETIEGAHAGIFADYDDVGAAQTDAEGVAVLLIPRGSDIQHVYAMKDNVGFDYKSFVLPRELYNDKNAKRPEFPEAGVTLTLDGVQPFRIKLLTSDGEPIPDVRVYPWLLLKEGEADDFNLSYLFRRPFIELHTDDAGVAVCPWVPHWHKQMLQVWPNSDTHTRVRGIYDPTTGTGELVMRLDRLVPLRGKVVMPDGSGARNITIDIAGAGHQFDDFRKTITTNDDGTYDVAVAPNMVYLLIVKDKDWAAEPKTGFAVWPNQPIDDLNFELRKTTRIHGRITLGSDDKPVAGFRVSSYQYGADGLNLEGIELPNPENSRRLVQPTLFHNAITDAEGNYEFFVGPGDFDIRGPNQTDVRKFQVIDEGEKRRFDFHMLQPERGILKGRVVAGDPPTGVAGAVVATRIQTNRSDAFLYARTDDNGHFELEREPGPGLVHAYSVDGRQGTVVEIDADATQVEIALRPTADATAVVVDSASKQPLPDREVSYTAIEYTTVYNDGVFRAAWGETKKTDAEGRFTMPGLAVGHTYYVSLNLGEGRSYTLGKVRLTEPGKIDLGQFEYRSSESVSYKPPTLNERIATAFKNAKTPIERFEASFPDVKLSRQRVLILLADAAGEPAKQFMTLRFEDDGVTEALYDFHIIPINSSPPHDEPAQLLAETFGESLTGEKSKFLIILTDDEGKPIDTAVATDLSTDGKIDREKVLAFLQKNTLEPLDAKTLLDEALAQAKTENKRVIVQETATWCGPCWSLSRFLQQHRDLWETDYIWVKMDHRWTGAQNLMAELRQEAEAGVPWWAILDADGKILVTSNTPEGNNIGFPSAPAEIEHFRTMVEQTAQRMTTEQIKKLVGDLQTRE